jgi:PA14 domain
MKAPPVPGKWRAAALYIALTLVLTYPLSLHPGDRLIFNDTDTQLGMWILSWDAHAFLHQPLSIFDANMYYPQTRTLAYQDNLIGSALLVAPILWLTGNAVLAFNAVSLLASVLCGLGAYVLARRVGLGKAAGLLGGLIFAFCPARFFRFPQIGLSAVQWIPFALAALHAYFDTGDRRQLKFAAAFFTLQTGSSGHGAVFLVVSIFTLLAYRFALGEPIAFTRRLRDLGFTGAFLLLLAALVYLPYRINQVQIGMKRGLGSWDTTPESFFASITYVHVRILSWLRLSWINERASGLLFVGYVPTFLAIAASAGAVGRGAVNLWTSWSKQWLAIVLQIALAIAIVRAAVLTLPVLGSVPITRAFVASGAISVWVVCAALAVSLLAIGRWRSHIACGDPRPLIAVVALVAALGFVTGIRSVLGAGDGLVARYYDNARLADPPAMTVIDDQPSTAAVSERWGGDPPQIFSVRWTGFLTVSGDRDYQFATTSDDASKLTIEGREVLDNGGSHSSLRKAGGIRLGPGSHRLGIDYAQFGGEYAFEWSWASNGTADRRVGWWLLSQRPTTYPAAIAARVFDGVLRICAAAALMSGAWWLFAGFPAVWRQWSDPMTPARLNPTPLYLILTLICIGLSLGPPISLWPYVYKWPGFSFIRASRRFMVLGALSIAVLAAIGFDRLAARLRPARRRMAAIVTGGLLVAEFAAFPLGTVPVKIEIPAADQWVARQPKPFVVAETPSGRYEPYQTAYMLHSMAHWQKTVAGYGGVQPPLNEELKDELQHFPDARSVSHLAQLGVTYVIVHEDMYPPGEWKDVEERLHEYEGSTLELKYTDPAARVYAIRPTAASTVR